MNRMLVGAMALALGAIPVTAQSLDDLNIQIHGYATQGFVYSTQNNWNSMETSDGSPSWTEAVFNVTSQPAPKLRVGIQARYSLLGNYGNDITLDWASADYKFNDKFGLRFGKVKTPSGLLNDTQDIDPAFLWSLLPQGMYPIASRNSILAHYGVVVYGLLPINKIIPTNAKLGKLEYQLFAGERVMAASDGFFVPIVESGAVFPNGLSGPALGAALHWKTPVDGLMLGVALDREDPIGKIVVAGPGFSGNNVKSPFDIPNFFGKYEHGRYMVAGEYSRVAATHKTVFTIGPPGVQESFIDHRQKYAMASYKVTDKLTAGAYWSSYFDLKMDLGPARYQKDWIISGRYDFNQYLYLKAEQHFMDGTSFGYLTEDNTNLKPTTKLTILKVGVSF
jgi:hypothetical protein